jgi:probable HAF family extracellular repeat protein
MNMPNIVGREAILLGAAFLIVGAGGAHAEIAYETHIIEPWDDSYSLASSHLNDLNDLGTGVGTAYLVGTSTADFLWTLESGKSEALIGASEINNLGVTAESGAIIYSPGEDPFLVPHPITGFAGGVDILDLNDNNVVVGAAPLSERTIAFIWDEVNGSRTLESLGVPATTRRASAINDDQVLVGTTSVVGEPHDEKAFVLDVETQTFTNLHLLLNPSGGGVTRALDISETGFVVGEGSHTDATAAGGFRWSESTGFDFLPGLAGGLALDVHPEGVNDAGVVVGRARDGSGEWRAFVWDETQGIRDLEELAVVPEGFNLQAASKITDQGWIVAQGFYGAAFGPDRAVVFVPQGVSSVSGTSPVSGVAWLRPIPVSRTNASAEITFELESAAMARLSVFDVRGREVAELVNGWRAAGTHEVRWGRSGTRGGAGVYFVRLQADDTRIAQRMVRLP